jgi:hypothetical protein
MMSAAHPISGWPGGGGTAEGRNFDDDEQPAWAAKAGLSADPNPMPPWEGVTPSPSRGQQAQQPLQR